MEYWERRLTSAGSQSLMVPAPQPEAILRPLCENATAHTAPLCSPLDPSRWPVATYQTLTERSRPPLTSLSPLGEKATDRTSSVWPCHLAISFPESISKS